MNRNDHAQGGAAHTVHAVQTQAALLERCFGDRRFAYNQQVEAFNTYDKETNPKPAYPNVTGMKNANEWLRDSPIPSNALSNAIMDFRKAQSAYFRKAQYGKHRPRFASRNDNIQSFRNTMPIRRMDGNRYPLSRKLGSVRIRKRDRLRYPIESLSSWTVKRENRTYYLVLLFDVDIQPKTRSEGRIGIDLGVKDFLTLSTGEKIDYPNRLRRLEKNVKREQRKLSRRTKGRTTTADRRRSWPRRTPSSATTAITSSINCPTADRREPIHRHGDPDGTEHDAEGTEEAGRGRQAHAQRPVTQTRSEPFHTPRRVERLVDKLSYKAEWYGRTLVQVDRFYPSSKLCHDCGHKYKGLRLSEREWTCENCHSRHDRDVNAALNIRDEAIRIGQENQ